MGWNFLGTGMFYFGQDEKIPKMRISPKKISKTKSQKIPEISAEIRIFPKIPKMGIFPRKSSKKIPKIPKIRLFPKNS